MHFRAGKYEKSKITKILNYEKNSNRKVRTQIAKSNDKTHQKRIDNNCHTPDLVPAFSNVEKGVLNLVFIALNLSLI